MPQPPVSTPVDFIPMIIMFIVAVGFVGGTMLATHILGPRRKTQRKLESFECGLDAKGNARIPFSVKYFLVSILFVLFDVEIIFMYPWAVNFKRLGVLGLFEMLTFMALLFIGFLYVLRRGALKWEN